MNPLATFLIGVGVGSSAVVTALGVAVWRLGRDPEVTRYS